MSQLLRAFLLIPRLPQRCLFSPSRLLSPVFFPFPVYWRPMVIFGSFLGPGPSLHIKASLVLQLSLLHGRSPHPLLLTERCCVCTCIVKGASLSSFASPEGRVPRLWRCFTSGDDGGLIVCRQNGNQSAVHFIAGAALRDTSLLVCLKERQTEKSSEEALRLAPAHSHQTERRRRRGCEGKGTPSSSSWLFVDDVLTA